MVRCRTLSVALFLILLWCPVRATAEQLCDPAAEDCRAILLNLIRSEPQAIDVAFWFMEDDRYASALIQRAQAGVRVRVIVDTRAPSPVNAQILAQLAAAGIPMRRRTAHGILHWKTMLFAGLQTVEFSGANFSPTAFVPIVPYVNYIDEAILFSDDAPIVQSFMRRFDDLWTDTTSYTNYANLAGTTSRRYPLYPVDPALNFPPKQSYRSRAVSRYAAETQGIDAIMYRITDAAHADALIAAVRRGVPVRLIVEPQQYRDPTRLWDSWNVDRLYMAGVQLRQRAHEGLVHQKSVVLKAQNLAIFGSSNWTSPSSDSQEEHNYFARKASIVDWFRQQFERKWNNLTGIAETAPFAPLPPDIPHYVTPAAGQTNVPTTADLVFEAGPFAHLYDVYFGTTPDPPLLEPNVALGPTAPGAKPRRYPLPPLQPNTTYYWRIVAKTAAMMARVQDVTSFTTGAATVPPPSVPPSPPPPSPPAPPAPQPPACPTVQPAPDWICVNGGWVPPDSPLAGPLPPPTGTPPPPASCPTIQPAPDWVCVNGGWVPPDSPLAQGSPSPAPAPPAPAPASPATCPSVQPAAGWVCVNGGWVPPDHPLAQQRQGGTIPNP